MEGYGNMLVAMAALDTLDDPSPTTVTARAEVVARLRGNAALHTLCTAPSLAPFGTLAECALLTGSASPSG